MNTKKRVLITGVGGVGVFQSHLIALLPDVELYLGDIREDYIAYKANCVMDNAMFSYQSNPFPSVHAVKMDLMDVEATTKQLAEIKPDVIIHLATLLAAQKIREGLPLEIATQIYDANPVGTGLRPWAPGHAVLLFNLMKSIKAAGIDTHVINGSGCDYLHVALDKYGLAPTCGLGDFALCEPALRRAIAKLRSVTPADVTVRLAGHHSIVMQLMFFGTNAGVPYYIDVDVMGENITDQLDFENEVFPLVPAENCWPVDAGASDQEQTAAHGFRIARAILLDEQVVLNVPAPEGQPGCYPARVGADGVKIVIPHNTNREALVAINEAGNVAEGFKEIREDGTMVATDLTVELVEKIFGIKWQYKEFTPENAFEAFKEIRTAYDAFFQRVTIEQKQRDAETA